MNTFAANISAADALSHDLIQERIRDARRRAQVRAVRADRRAARRAARHVSEPLARQPRHDLRWRMLHFLSPVR